MSLCRLEIATYNSATTKVNGTITASIGAFTVELPYYQYAVPLYVQNTSMIPKTYADAEPRALGYLPAWF
jgi:hypothetical protein